MNYMEKIALVTGGGSGIGLAITEKLVHNNIRTVIVGRNAQKLADAQQKLGPLCETFTYDLSELSGLPQFVEELFKRFGHIDILVNNAGIHLKKEFTAVSDEEFQRILATNVTSVFALSREVIKQMLTHNIKGCIINISSM